MGLGPIDENVRFDHEAASSLISLCNSAAGVIEGQTSSRAGWVTTAKEDFAGYFSELFARNQENAQRDATEIATRLRDVARFTGLLATEATQEQQRREEARAWQRERDDREWYEEGWDWLTNNNDAPVPDMPEPSNFTPTVIPPQPRETPTPGSGGGSSSGGTSSARPAKLRTFASGSRGANSSLSGKPTTCRSAYNTFVAGCGWGTLVADDVFAGFSSLLNANEEDVRWVDTIATAFERAGSDGSVSTLSNSALTAALQAQGIDASRQDIVVDPPQAMGNPPTSGYADDPVNAATGNFLENETDLAFTGGNSTLALGRTYNSFDSGIGAFGPGWSSWTETGLEITDESARMRLEDGRVIVFPRHGDGWERATGESRWLVRDGHHLVATTNDGERRVHSADGRLVEVSRGTGTGFALAYDEAGRLVRLDHVRGRSIELTWSDEWTEGRVVEARTSDGRTASYAYDEAGHLVAASTAAGTRTYQWDDQGLIVAVVDADGVVEVENTYDGGARVTAQRSAHGRISRYVYLDGNVTVVSDRDGTRSNTWISDARGRLIGVVDSDEQRTSFAYDAHGNRVMVTHRDRSVTVREHDDRGRMVREVTPSGADLTYGYDDHDRVTTVVTESGAVTEYTYDDDTGAARNPSLLVDPEGGRTTLEWQDGLLTRLVDPVGVEVRFTYDAHGDLLATTDALGHTASLERDAQGRVVASVTATGHRSTYTYAPSGLVASRRDPDGAVWHYEHTAGGRLSAIVDPTGARTEIEHNDAGDAARTIDPLGRSITRHFDDLGNLATAELPDGATWHFTHDAMSRLVATVDPLGGTWRREFDATGRLITSTDPDGEVVRHETDLDTMTVTVDRGDDSSSVRVDALGRPVATHSTDGGAVMSTYDRCGRVVEQLDADGGLTRIERDVAGRVRTVTSPAGVTRSYDYDARGRLAAVIDAAGGRTLHDYDADGRLIAVTAPTGEVSTVDYDPCGRVLATRRPGHGVSRYRYDAAGRVVEASDTWHGHRRFRYDAAGQLVAVVNGNGGTTRYDYDAGGRVVAITDPLGQTTRRDYDALNRLVAHTDPLGRTASAGHDCAGRLTWHQDASGRRVEWTYDRAGRKRSISVDGRLLSVSEFDHRERRLTVTDHTRATPSTIELEWNHRRQPVRRSHDGAQVAWTYDADGRRTSVTGPDGTARTFTYDAAGHLVAVDHAVLGRVALTRDASGRLVEASAQGVMQTWEHADGFVVAHTIGSSDGFTRTEIHRDDTGRITEVSAGGEVTVFGYDEARQLVEARTGGVVDRWHYDAAGRLVAESSGSIRVDHTYDAAGQIATSTDGDRTTTYTHDAAGRRTLEQSSDGMQRHLEWSPSGHLSAVEDRLPGGQQRRLELHVDATGLLAQAGGIDVHWDVSGFSPEPVQVGDLPVVAAGPVTGVGDLWTAPGWRTQRSLGADPWTTAGGVGTSSSTITDGLPAGVCVGADGGLSVAGMEWLTARVYDPAARGFLSIDPVDAKPGVGWMGNPYSYAGNDPLHALDPTGLEPLSPEALEEYNASNNTGFAAAGEWVAGNWEYLVAAGAIIVGGALIFTGVGGPLGGMLIGGGIDLAMQKATLKPGESIRWDQVAVNTALGAVPGAGSLAGRIPGITSAGRRVVGEGITGFGTGFAGGSYSYLTSEGPHSVSGYLQSAGTEAVIGMGAGGLQGVDEVAGIQHAFNSRTPVPRPDVPNHVGSPGDELVIGQTPDVEVAADWPGHHAPGTEIDDAAVQQAIDYQRPVYLGSEPGAGFSAPMQMLENSGYVRQGDYMVPGPAAG